MHKTGIKGTWIETYEKMGYSKHQVGTLIKKYEIAENFNFQNLEISEENKLMLDYLVLFQVVFFIQINIFPPPKTKQKMV
ncbi:MAG: hypothetical protein ACRC0Y_01565 [Fusobacteriaceae bacterium]